MKLFDLYMHKLNRIFVYVYHYVSGEIAINGYFFYNEDGTLKHNNFGDDVNFPLLNALTGKKIREWNRIGLRNIKNLMCIGSMLEHCNEQSIIWGTGCIYGNQFLEHKPKKVYAVRGPLTRKLLLQQGIDCPPIYGDPALLLPLIYQPKSDIKKYKIGFIPHYIDYNLPHVAKFRNEHPEILFIKFEGYSTWQDVIDQMNSCECIISSSLHGLIVSDAYRIPNVRIILSDNITGGDFKYKDYMAGVNRLYKEPVNCRRIINLKEILRHLEYYEPVNFDNRILLKAFPYKLKRKYQ